MENEIWKPLPGNPNYEVSDAGHVRSLTRLVNTWQNGRTIKGRVLRPQRQGGGYLMIPRIGGIKGPQLIHKLVLEAFVGPRPEGMQARHLNGIRTDNRLCNLAWGTPKENNADKVQHGTAQRGEKAPRAKLNRAKAAEIRASREPAKTIAPRYGVSVDTVYGIRCGRFWR